MSELCVIKTIVNTNGDASCKYICYLYFYIQLNIL